MACGSPSSVAEPPASPPRMHSVRIAGTRTPMSDRALLAAAVRYHLMTAQVIELIHHEAIKMRLAGVLYRVPGPDHRPHPATEP